MSRIPSLERVVWAVLVGLTIFTCAGLVVRFLYNQFDISAYLAGIAALAVAVLTAAYVLTTVGQLSVMRAQLNAMRQTYEYQSCPLLHSQSTSVKLARPRVFYSPPDAGYSGQSRLFATYEFLNAGPHPAVAVIASLTLYVPGDGTTVSDRSCSSAMDIVAAASNGADTSREKHNSEFMFVEESLPLMRLLRERDVSATPFLGVVILFKNTLGGAYASRSFFSLSVKDAKDDEVLKRWYSASYAFDAHFKTEIAAMRKLQHHSGEWKAIFDKVKGEFEQQVPGPEALELAVRAVPLSFEVGAISAEMYASEAERARFGVAIPHWLKDCLADESEKNKKVAKSSLQRTGGRR